MLCDGDMEEVLDARLREIKPAAFHDLITAIAEIDEFKGWFQGRSLSDVSMLHRLNQQVVKISAAASLRIGGGERVRNDVSRQWRVNSGIRKPDPRDAAHVAGYAELLQAVFHGYHHMQLEEDLILQFHSRVLKYSHADQLQRGKYKTISDSSRSYLDRKMEPLALRATDPDLAPQAVAAATAWTASRLGASEFHPLLVIASFILEFLAIRPFTHGNGRVSRILTNLLLLQRDYVHAQYVSLDDIIAERWAEYYLALRRSQANASLPRPDITSWLAAFLETLQTQTRQLKALLARDADTRVLSANQLRVLNLLERSGEITNRLLRDELGMPKDTAKQVLNRLTALNLVQRRGAGRAVTYRKAPLQAHSGAAR
jgi:Fic family protein